MIRLPSNHVVTTAAGMRAAEEAAFGSGTSQEHLMQHASDAVARTCARFALGRPILVLAGPGNNGGDAYGAAAVLRETGHDVAVAALGEPVAGAAATMARRWGGPVEALDRAEPRPVVIDGLFGTGMRRSLDAEVAGALERLLHAAAFRLAIDLPSGVDTDTGALLGASIAMECTLALGALKPAHLLIPSAARCGTVLLDPIGLAIEGPWRTLARPTLSPPDAGAHKYSRGMVVVVGGAMRGAARLAAAAALHGGAGYVVGCGVEGGPDALVHRAFGDLDDLLSDERVGAVVIGPGLGRAGDARGMVDAALASDRALVLDGDALSLLGTDLAKRVAGRSARTVLTPHGGEFNRCFPDADGSKIDHTLAAARAAGAVIVHKGADTVIAHPDGSVVLASGMTSWLSTAGTGDVLAGLIGERIAGGGSVEDAVWLHADAARHAAPAFAADDLIAQLPAAIDRAR